MRLRLILFTTLAVLGCVTVARAEPPEWQKVPRQSEYQAPKPVPLARTGERLVELELGYTGVLAPGLVFPMQGRHEAGAHITFLPELTGFGVEYRYRVRRNRPRGLGAHVGSSLSLFKVSDGDRTATPGAISAFVGTMYKLENNVGIGAEFGLISTSGSTGEKPVKAFGIHKGLSTSFVSVQVGFFF